MKRILLFLIGFLIWGGISAQRLVRQVRLLCRSALRQAPPDLPGRPTEMDIIPKETDSRNSDELLRLSFMIFVTQPKSCAIVGGGNRCFSL